MVKSSKGFTEKFSQLTVQVSKAQGIPAIFSLITGRRCWCSATQTAVEKKELFWPFHNQRTLMGNCSPMVPGTQAKTVQIPDFIPVTRDKDSGRRVMRQREPRVLSYGLEKPSSSIRM